MARPGTAGRAASDVADALAAYAAEDFDRAATASRRARGLAPRSGRVRELLGLSLYRAGSWKEAAGELMTYRRVTGSLDQNHVIADCHRAMGNGQRAVEICGEVDPTAVTPEVWTEVLIVGAAALADLGLVDRALARLARSELDPSRVEPRHLRLWYVRADLLERAGRGDEACRLWERIVSEDPHFFDASERLASPGSTMPHS